jgi:predicted lipoprotein with Yx(FWY)xxD motif
VKLRSSRTLLGVASVALLVAAAACGDDDDNSAATTAAPAATTAAPAATTAAPATTQAAAGGAYGPTPSGATATTAASGGGAAAGAAVALADSSLGKILVDSKGMTLYMFEPDNKGPSTCTGGCAGAWPALPGPVTAGAGVDASKLGTAKRSDDNTEQATYGGWPLYTYAKDTKPGDVTGQDSGGVWYVIGADGNPIED